jgi:hypothetical protein
MAKRHPPFYSDGPGYAAAGEWMTEQGAHALAARIAAAWAKCGVTMRTEVVECGRINHAPKGTGNAIYTVRMPTMLNGLPAKT